VESGHPESYSVRVLPPVKRKRGPPVVEYFPTLTRWVRPRESKEVAVSVRFVMSRNCCTRQKKGVIFNVDINGELIRVLTLVGTAAFSIALIALDWIVSGKD